jgi:GT2 family glycosyltransferase
VRERVGIVVLNYLHADDTFRCVRSIQHSQHIDASLFVIDNGSGKGVVEDLRENLDPVIPVLDNGDNLGYAAGNNVGIRRALADGADFVWILNPDTVVEPDTLTRMIRVMWRYPQAGIVGTRILNGAYNPPTIWFNGGMIDWDAEGATTHRDIGRPHDEVPSNGVRSVDYVTGASMLVRRGVFDDVGLFSEHYFLYFEETDFCTRAKGAGWFNLIDSGAILWHYKRSAARTPSPYYVYYFCRGRLLFRSRFVDGPTEQVPQDLTDFIEAWRRKVADRAPRWLDTYDQLVTWAIADGLAGVHGRRDDIAGVPSAEEITP